MICGYMMERAREMMLLSAVLLYLANGVCSQACNDTDIRLVEGRNNLEGRVEVCYQRQWGTVCDDFWDNSDGMVACRQLGLTSEYAVAITSANNNGVFAPGTGRIFLDNVHCIGNETNIDDCSHSRVGVHNCLHSEDAGVICPEVAVCNNTDIRLVGGRNELEGRVEVCYQGQWGTVCDDSWDTRDATVVCRQLGLTSDYAIALTIINNNGIFVRGVGAIFLDNVRCRGDETNLDDCPHNGVGNHDCFHSEDAGVICPLQACNSSDIRLVGGMNNSELQVRVEVCYQGQWGTVCGDLWDFRDAMVVCRQLGLTSKYAIAIHVDSNIFVRGVGPIFLDNVRCRGNETNLADCPHRGVGVHNCGHSKDAGVICPEDATCNNTDIRLVGGRNYLEGRVEVCYQGQWGTVCDDSWDNSDAIVVCRQLGLNTENAIALTRENNNGIFVRGVGPIFLDDVGCRGDESNLDDCPHRGVGVHNCIHNEDAGVICDCNNSDIRLVGGRNNSEGRVEVCFQGQWGTVCDDFWDSRDAMVVCRQLGLSSEYAKAISVSSNIFVHGVGPIFLDNVNCRGNETNLADCPHRGVGIHNCLHSEDAGVICQQVGACNNTDIRLVRGRNNLEGRVEVCFQGQWGTVCDDFWDFRDAMVVCRQLGLTSKYAKAINVGNNIIVRGVGPIFLDNVGCRGDETNLADCPPFKVGVHNCIHSEDAGVICSEVPVCNNTDTRLIGGRNHLEGRVEVCFQGDWGTVCDDFWDTRDAVVACRQLGLTSEYAIAITDVSNFGPGTGFIFLNGLGCSGDETNLDDCPHRGVGVHNCDHYKDAGVVCPPQACNDTDIRLVGGRNNLEGRVEVCFQGQWGTVCDDLWDIRDAIVVCRQLGLTSEYAIAINVNSGIFGPGVGLISLDEVSCSGMETNLADCPHTGVGNHNCDHDEDAGVICSQQECTDGTVRLVDGISEKNGRVEFCYRGIWGTVCDDLWDNNDATVVCRQLGYSTVGATATQFPHFGPGAGFIVLDNVNCNGSEANFAQCRHDGFGVHDCRPSEDAGVFCSGGRVERCTVDVETTQSNASQTRLGLQEFGSCEQYEQASDLCNAYFNETDYVYIPKTMSQSQIAATLSRISTTNISTTAECRDNVLKIICHRFFVPCGRNGTIYLPTSICQEECSYVKETCQTFWNQTFEAIESELGRINCESPGSVLSPLPTCCTGASVSIPTTGASVSIPTTTMPTASITALMPSSSTPEVTSFQVSASIIGGAMGGALILVILLLVLVVIIAAVLVRRRKAAVQSLQLEVLASPHTPEGINLQHFKSREACNSLPNFYSRYNSASPLSLYASNAGPGSRYVRQLSERTLISQENIKLLECIGQGEFGIVYKAQLAEMGTQPFLKAVAVKTLKGFFDQNEINKIMEESVKMKQFNHPNVMNLIGVCINAGPAPYIIMPFMANGSLLSYLRKERPNLILDKTTDEDLVLEVKKRLTVMCSQIASGMEYLTQESFIHRDLATRNCMIDAHFVIKVADFGLSEDVYARNYFRQGKGPSVKLPVKWMAPESLQDGIFSDKTDVWSFGVTCWEIFSGGKSPYPGVDPLSLVQLLENGQRLSKPANSACPDEMYSIMLKCWNSDPNERPSFSVLVNSISGFAEKTAGYLDVSSYNPFEASIPTATLGGENCDDQTCSSEDGSPHDESLL